MKTPGYYVQFRSGSYWAPSTEETMEGVTVSLAHWFSSKPEAEHIASHWLLAGAMVVSDDVMNAQEIDHVR